MNIRTAEYRTAVDNLPPGGTLVFKQVTWDEYEELVNGLTDRAGVRVSYDEGRLEIMSPLPEHEKYKDSLYRFTCAFAEEFGITLESYGSTTWKRRGLQKGSQPDTCFYVANAGRVVRKRTIDLEADPPPDIVVEIDSTNESLRKLPIYAGLAVPEIWRYDGMRVQMYALAEGRYVEIPGSRSLQGLSGKMLTEALEQTKSVGQTESLVAFRQRIRLERG
jgi:Uma2 family endonuclease